MKRMLSITLVLTLVLALALPAAAFAKRGGVPANGNGKGKPAVTAAPDVQDPAVDDQAVAKNNANANANKDGKGKKDKSTADGTEGTTASEETSPAAATEKLTGIANALSRLQRNLARKQAAFDAGLRDSLPAGLQATIAKFMSWLGIAPTDGTMTDATAPDADTAAQADEADDSADEASETVEPDEAEDIDEPADTTTAP